MNYLRLLILQLVEVSNAQIGATDSNQRGVTESGELTSTSVPTRAQLNAANWPISLISTAATSQVTYVKYDESLGGTVASKFTGGIQENLRTRIASTWYKETSTDATYLFASHFSYDIHGNVKELLQENTMLSTFGQDFKKIVYAYDLISGNVNEVQYQAGQYDEFYHKYIYDADNRITRVYTSSNNVVWDLDAKYQYYLHGPIARTEIGQHKVQGIDYAYTINGWLKGVNGNELNQEKEIGRDGYNGTTGGVTPYTSTRTDLHTNFARDAFGFTLGYFDYDYAGNATHASDYLTDIASLNSGSDGNNLYNGNIKHMATALMNTSQTKIDKLGAVYTYDQLNRITSMNAWLTGSTSTYASATNNNDYKENYTYDANGNILTLTRNGVTSTQQSMDNFTYNYTSGKNQLTHVTDAVSTTPYTEDIESQLDIPVKLTT